MEVTCKVNQFLGAKIILDSIGLKSTEASQLLLKWQPLKLKWIKINSNGLCVNGGNKTTCGGVLRDNFRHQVLGFNLFTSQRGVLSTELYGALQGLSLAWDMGFKRVWLEMDSVENIELMEQGCLFSHPCHRVV